MRTCVLLVFVGLAFVTAKAQDSAAVTISNHHVTILQDTSVENLLGQYKQYNQKREFTDGYRIQILYTDVRDEAYKDKSTMYVKFPELAPYVEYEQPYFKLRIGDFKSRLEATYYLQQVIPLYPGAFIVKDKIKLQQQ